MSDITAMHNPNSVAKRLLSNFLITSNGCWEWQGCKNKEGYGRIYVYSRVYMYTHRASFEVYHGRTVVQGLHVLHKCNNPKCINPNHLYEGTPKDNYQDQVAAKTCAVGEKHGHAKRSLQDVRRMIADYENGMPVVEICKKYNCKYSTAWSTVKRIIWRTA